MLARLRSLYDGDDADAHRFRYGLLLFDLTTVLFIVVTSFIERRGTILEAADVAIGTIILADFVARLMVSRDRVRDLLRPSTVADLIALASFLAPIAGEAGGFLRVLRTLRLLRTYHVAESIRRDFPLYRHHEEVIVAIINLAVFLFVMTGIVYETQHWSNPAIRNYADALYFTVTALTTTGFGDITLPGTTGRMISVLIMIFGVTLFLRLAQVLFRPNKVRFACPSCGLQRHDPDAVHCKACGTLINIPDEGAY
jgi:voltage-gated potassium channel